MPMPQWWLRQRAEARARKAARLRPSTDVWTTGDPDRKSAFSGSDGFIVSGGQAEVAEFVEAMPHTWYAFCVKKYYAYQAAGSEVAALVYWALRYVDGAEIGSDQDPCTEAGYADLCAYWAYKLEWLERTSRDSIDATL